MEAAIKISTKKKANEYIFHWNHISIEICLSLCKSCDHHWDIFHFMSFPDNNFFLFSVSSLSSSQHKVTLWTIDLYWSYFVFFHNEEIASKACACYNQGICDPQTGSCICPAGFLGQQCEQSQRMFNDFV